MFGRVRIKFSDIDGLSAYWSEWASEVLLAIEHKGRFDTFHADREMQSVLDPLQLDKHLGADWYNCAACGEVVKASGQLFQSDGSKTLWLRKKKIPEIKATSISVEDDVLVLRRWFRSWRIRRQDITFLHLIYNDMIGISVSVAFIAGERFTFSTDLKGFEDAAAWFDFDHDDIFTGHWYDRLVEQDVLTHVGPLPDSSHGKGISSSDT